MLLVQTSRCVCHFRATDPIQPPRFGPLSPGSRRGLTGSLFRLRLRRRNFACNNKALLHDRPPGLCPFDPVTIC